VAGSRLVSREAAAAELTIRPMDPRDLDAVLEMERAIYPQPWSRPIFDDELRQPGRVYVVALADGALVGYAGVMLVADDAHVTTLAVDPAARRDRIGTRLMLYLVERVLQMGARHLTLEVRMSNRAAQRLYSRFGMAPVGVRKAYYVDEDALIMWATDIDGDEYVLRIGEIRRRLEASDDE
jgi:[ribosomal protein S18]-alanine N-acetyltransferase